MMDFLGKVARITILMIVVAIVSLFLFGSCSVPTDAQELPQVERMDVVDSGYILNHRYYVVQDTIEGNTCYFMPASSTLTCPLSIEFSETTSEEY